MTRLAPLLLLALALTACATTPKGQQKQHEVAFSALVETLITAREAREIDDPTWDKVVVLIEAGDTYLDNIDAARKAGQKVQLEANLRNLADTVQKLEALRIRKVTHGSGIGRHQRGDDRPEVVHRLEGSAGGGADRRGARRAA